MDKAIRAVRFDPTTKCVITQTKAADGTTRETLVTVDVAEAIHGLFVEAGSTLPLTDPEGTHIVTGFAGEAYEGEFHLVIRTLEGEQAIFVFSAPGKSQPQVADVSDAIRDAMMRLLPKAN